MNAVLYPAELRARTAPQGTGATSGHTPGNLDRRDAFRTPSACTCGAPRGQAAPPLTTACRARHLHRCKGMGSGADETEGPRPESEP